MRPEHVAALLCGIIAGIPLGIGIAAILVNRIRKIERLDYYNSGKAVGRAHALQTMDEDPFRGWEP